MDGEEQIQFKKKERQELVNQVIENEEDELETHFVENPFIRKRVRANDISGKVKLGEAQLEGELAGEDHDVYILKETGKFVVRDEELDERAREEKRKRKREGQDEDSDTDSDEEQFGKKGASARDLKKIIKTQKGSKGVLNALQRRKEISKDKS